jgi:hypothetical protein
MTMRLNHCSGIGVLVVLMVLAPAGIGVADQDGIAVAGHRNIATVHAGATIHVPADYPTIQEAIAAASDGDEIIVAPRTYNEAIDFLGKAIHLRSGEGPDATTIDAAGLNSSVVQCTNGEGPDSILEGFTVTGGTGTVVGNEVRGGGIYNLGSSPTVLNCIIEENNIGLGTARRGGGMGNFHGSHPAVTNCTFRNNSARDGGGMANFYGSNPTVTGCIFENNMAGWDGGGMRNRSASPNVTSCTFIGNTANRWGGGIANSVSSSPVITNCDFLGNTGNSAGGGMHSLSGAVVVTECVFESNSGGNGGAMFDNTLNTTITDSVFRDNLADRGGGLYAASSSNSSLSGCIFELNAGDFGAGMFIESGANIGVATSAFCGNHRENVYGPWSDGGDNILTHVPCDSSCYFENCDSQVSGGCWCDDGCWARGDCCADVCAACDTCQGLINVPADLLSIQDAIHFAAEGAEIIVAPGHYLESIDLLGKALHLRSSDGPEMTILDANEQTNTSVIRCVSGEGHQTVIEGLTITGGTGTFVFDDPNFPTGQRRGGGLYNYSSSPTVIHCIFQDNQGSNSGGGGMGNFYGSSPIVIDCSFINNTHSGVANYFLSSPTVQNCVFDDNSSGGMYNSGGSNPLVADSVFKNGLGSAQAGGGMSNFKASAPLLENCHFIGNSGPLGGAMRNVGSSPTIYNCTFDGNYGWQRGGAIYNNNGSSPVVIGCAFHSNWATNFGGAIYNRDNSNIIVTETHFLNNAVTSGGSLNLGGAMININSNPVLSESTFIGNTARSGGGIANTSASAPTIVGCIFKDNQATHHQGGGMYSSEMSHPTVLESTFASNSASQGGGVFGAAGTLLSVGNTLFCGNMPDHLDGSWDDLGGNEFHEICPFVAHLDIRPGSCPNPLNPNSQGVLPVALLGTDEFDVSAVNLETLTLSRADGIGGSVTPNFGPPGHSPKIEDVATPFDGDDCDCHDLGGDGILDLSLKFWMGPLVEALALDAEYSDTYIELSLTGELNDGTPFIANDCVRIVGQPQSPSGQLLITPETGIPWLDRFLNELHHPSHRN